MVGHIEIHGEIGTRVTLKSVSDQIIPGCEEYMVHLSSEGGDVYEGIEIYHKLRSLKNVTVVIEGLAASIATLIMQAGDKIIALRPSDIMIHNPWGGPISGEAKDFRDAAAQLERVKSTIISVIKKRLQKSDEEIVAMMDKQTWMSADEAKKVGLVDEVQEKLKAVAKFDPNKFKMGDTLTKEEAKGLFADLGKKLQSIWDKINPRNIMEETLEDGTKIMVHAGEGEDWTGKPVTTEDGKPLQDGNHKLASGKTIVVKDGIIAEIKEQEMENKELKAAQDEIKKLKEQLEAKTKETEATNKSMLEIKNSISELQAIKNQFEELKKKTFGDEGLPPNPAPDPDDGKEFHPVFLMFHNDAIEIFRDRNRAIK